MTTAPDEFARVVMMRHGETTWNSQKIVQGHADESILTERGRDHVRETIGVLEPLELDLIISSDLERAIETASIVAGALGLTIVTDPALRERSFGVLEGGPLSAATPALTGIDGEWVTDDMVRPEGGETLAELYSRTATVIDRTTKEFSGRRVLLVTHGGAIRTMRAYCEGVTMRGRQWDVVANCSIWRVELPRVGRE